MRRDRLIAVVALLGVFLAGPLSPQAGSVPATTSSNASPVGFSNGDMDLGGAVPEGWSLNWTGAGKLDLARDTETYKSAPDAPIVDTDAAPLPVAVSWNDPRVRYVRRFNTADPAGPRCAWSASAVTLRFRGTGLNVKLADGSSNAYQIVVDGKPTAVLTTQGGTHLYSVFRGPRGTHTVTLVKRTEAFFGTTQFEGFQLAQGGKLLPLPPRPRRRLEVIGDSISCGYGNEAKDQTEHFSATTENAYLTYGALAARTLGAEYVCVAWSGRLMWPKNTMGEVYDRTLPADANSRWDFGHWIPDAVVINLSTNDFAGGVPDKAGWVAGYEAFLTRVRKNYPKATLFCASSPMLWGAPVGIAKSYLTQIVQDENAAGDRNVHLLVFDTQDAKNGMGADWHPSIKTHAIMADKLSSALQADLGWKPVAQTP